MSSKNELMLKEFFNLNQKIKEQTKRLEELKEIIKEKGTHSTMTFTAIVDTKVRNGIDTDAVIMLLGPACPMKATEYKAITVRMKG